MSRSAGGISKDKRKRTIIEVLRRWGRLNQAQIASHLASSIGMDTGASQRTLYRDLEELVAEGEISEFRFAPDGATIPDYDPITHKSTHCEWAIRNQENSVNGGLILEKYGGKILASQRLVRDIKVDTADPSHQDEDVIRCFFGLGNDSFVLSFDASALPGTLIVARSPNADEPTPDLVALERDLGKRLIFLLLPIPTISAIKPPERLGHCHIRFDSRKKMQIEDKNSTNGTFVAGVEIKDVKEFVRRAALIRTATVTASSQQVLDQRIAFTPIESATPKEFSPPAIVSLSKSLRLLLF